MKVRDLLRRKPSGFVEVAPTATAADAAGLLIDEGIGGLPVVEERHGLVGFVSERDIVRLVHRRSVDMREVRVAEMMTRPAPTVFADDTVQAVMGRMTRERLRHLVVMDEDEILGVISVGDIVKQRLEQLETEAGVLRDYVAGQRARG